MKKYWSQIANETEWKSYELDLDKVESLEDCKKILKFLCGITMKPMPSNVEYGGFDEVREYFK